MFPGMILGAHIILTAYGFWFPNEARGSWSDFVRSWELFRFGPATKVETRRSVAGKPYDRHRRKQMQDTLSHPPVSFNGRQALAIARGFAAEVKHGGCDLYACSILPEHVHLVAGRHDYDFEKLINRLKGSATRMLSSHGLHPFAGQPYRDGSLPTPWTRKWWKVYLDSPEDMRRAIAYTEGNPAKEGKRVQKWPFVAPYSGPSPF